MLDLLLKMFDDDEGVNESGYEFAFNYIKEKYSTASAQAFADALHGNGGRYYFSENFDIEDLMKRIEIKL